MRNKLKILPFFILLLSLLFNPIYASTTPTPYKPLPNYGDGIKPITGRYEMVPVEKQLWDSLTDEEKKEFILVGNKIIINKKDSNGNPIKGVKFALYTDEKCTKKVSGNSAEQTTDKNGKAEFKYLDFGKYYLKETYAPKGYKLSSKVYKFYVDDGTRFLGEVEAGKFITGNKLASDIGLTRGTSINSNTQWFKYQMDNEIVYIPKKPFRYNLSWNDINAANAVFGNKTVTINGKTYRVRLLKAYNEKATTKTENDITFVSPSYGENNKGSEWNKLILPLVVNQEGERYGSSTANYLGTNIPQLAKYNWFTNDESKADTTSELNNLGASNRSKRKGIYNGQWRWTQELAKRSYFCSGRGYSDSSGAAVNSYSANPRYANSDDGWLPVLVWVP